MKTYSTRSSAIRAARAACRSAMKSPIFSAYEGHDFVIQEKDVPGYLLERFAYVLRGPCRDAADGKIVE